MSLIEASLDGYAYQYLDAEQQARWQMAYDAKGPDHREFTEVFGPEFIAENLGEFLSYFLRRKVMASAAYLKVAAATTAKLAEWLVAKAWADPAPGRELAEEGRAAARDLPRAQKLAGRLHRWVANESGSSEIGTEDIFRVRRLSRDRIWLAGTDAEEYGPIRLPEEFVSELAVGWSITGGVARRGRSWRFVDVWDVGPA